MLAADPIDPMGMPLLTDYHASDAAMLHCASYPSVKRAISDINRPFRNQPRRSEIGRTCSVRIERAKPTRCGLSVDLIQWQRFDSSQLLLVIIDDIRKEKLCTDQ